jgi:hypothetical protein
VVQANALLLIREHTLALLAAEEIPHARPMLIELERLRI